MNKFLKNKILVFSFLSLILTVSCIQIALFATQSKMASGQQINFTSLQVRVTNLDNLPLQNATVVIAETKQYAKTDKDGYTQLLNVPFEKAFLDEIADGRFAYVTLVVFCEGYVDTILFNCIIYQDRTRNGPTITMLDKNQTSAPYVALTETPHRQWTDEFLKKIKENQ